MGYRFYLTSAYPIKYENYVNSASELYGVDESLVYAIIRTESKFDETATSHAGAIGLMQILPSTFEWVKSKSQSETSEEDLKSPEINIDCGVHLISLLIDRYESLDTAICAYNAGIGTIDKWLKDPKTSTDGKQLIDVPYPETKNYVKRVRDSQKMYKRLYFNKKFFC